MFGINGEILVIPFPHPGHIFPAIELSRRLADRNLPVTIFLPSTSTPSSSLHPLIRTVVFSIPHPTRFGPQFLEDTIPGLLTYHCAGQSSPPLCAVVDEMISWVFDSCSALNIPAVAFFTSSACSAAVEHAARLPPGQSTLTLPGLPVDFTLTASDIHHGGSPPPRHGGSPPPHHHHGPPPPPRHGGSPPPHHRGHSHGSPRRRRGMDGAAVAAAALLINTCYELERPFLDYMVAAGGGKPVWGVGPLLPESFWGSPVRDGAVRSGRESTVSEGEVLAWLDSQTKASVLYVSFGSLVSPSDEELAELAAGLVESGRPFIWAVQAEATSHGEPVRGGEAWKDAAADAGKRGMVICGWAPQLLILSHPSTGAYVCHCGWNSTVEALGCGVPVLTWPVRGDQFLNAKLVTRRLAAGFDVREGGGEEAAVTKEDVTRGIEKVMTDEKVRLRAAEVRADFAGGFPASSSAALDAFVGFVSADRRKN